MESEENTLRRLRERSRRPHDDSDGVQTTRARRRRISAVVGDAGDDGAVDAGVPATLASQLLSPGAAETATGTGPARRSAMALDKFVSEKSGRGSGQRHGASLNGPILMDIDALVGGDAATVPPELRDALSVGGSLAAAGA